MIETFANIFKIPDLRKRIFYTLFFLFIYRIGCHVPSPGINTSALAEFMSKAAAGTIFGFYDMFSGGAFLNMTIFSLGIMPYISASIILQLLTVVVPKLAQLAKEGEAGRKKITQYTRYGTVVLSVIQSFGIAVGLEAMQGGAFVLNPGWGFRLMMVITLTAGTAFIMWLGEQITERGVGNGISLIIFAGIIAAMPSGILSLYQRLLIKEMELYEAAVIGIIVVAVIALIIIVQQGQRRIPVQYAKRVVGRKMYGGQSTHIPMKINTAGVIPIIFAASIIMFPTTIANFLPKDRFPFVGTIMDMLAPGAPLYMVIYTAAIVFFCYFYTAIIFNPVDLADNMKKYGGFIPGIRPGKRTADYIDRVLTRVTLVGSIFLAAIAIMPTFLIKWFNIPFYFGGTSLLIVIGVGLDTVQQIESHLLMRHYEGFMRKGSRRRSK